MTDDHQSVRETAVSVFGESKRASGIDDVSFRSATKGGPLHQTNNDGRAMVIGRVSADECSKNCWLSITDSFNLC